MIYTIDNKSILLNLKINNLVIGFFDGIHLGHLKLFNSLNDEKFSVLTFNFTKHNTNPLFTFDERINQLIKIKNLENLIILDLNKVNFTSAEFIENFLKKWLIQNIVVGSDFRFGSDQQDVNYLKKFFNVTVINRDDLISSTNIKRLIKNGDIFAANKLLFNKYYYQSNVISGNKLGRELGYKTANFYYDDSLVLPSDGVYITSSILDDIEYMSVTFIGIPKTIDGKTQKQFETHLINYFGEDFYNKQLKVIFHKKIGNVIKYPSLSALKSGINKQIELAKKFFSK